MNFWAPDNLQRITGGLLEGGMRAPAARAIDSGPAKSVQSAASIHKGPNPAQNSQPPAPLSTDTRTLIPGQVFLAIRGENFDGNTKVGEAVKKGASLAIIDNPAALPENIPDTFAVLHVSDSRRALAAIAAEYRSTILAASCIIAVCGSNGKTTTVRMIDAALSQALRGRASPKSFNNDIGVPLTLLSATPEDQYIICEVGTNAPGEIANLGAIVRPDIAIITSIGHEHLEKLGSLAGVAREEASILEFLGLGSTAGRAGTRHGMPTYPKVAIINGDAPHLSEAIAHLRRRPATMLRFGINPAWDLSLAAISQSTTGVRFSLRALNGHTEQFEIPLLGRHNALNGAAAVAVARLLGLTDRQIASGLMRVVNAEMRLEVHDIAGATIINDAYNANPDSMRTAMDTLAEVGAGAARRVLILGDMLELGAHSDSAHQDIVHAAADLPGLDLLILIGPAMLAAARTLGLSVRPEVVTMADLDDARAREAAELLRAGDCVILKGSRRMRLERILSAARAESAVSGTLEE